MDYLTENRGSFVGVLGVIVSSVGLWCAFRTRRAAKSSEKAAREALARTIGSIDVERTVALITRLIELNRQGNWDYALALYQDLKKDTE